MPAIFSWPLFKQMPVVGIMRNIAPARMEKIAALFFENGFTTLEVTMNSPGAADMIRKLSTDYDGRLNIGAGTVCTLADLDEALAAGASFIVTPVLVEDVILAAVQRNVPIFPGAYTPSEIYRAWSLGASMIKVFPATKLGPEYFRDVLAPLPQIKLLPTGGVNAENFAAYMKAGAAGAGAGSPLFPPQLISSEDWDGIVQTWNNFKTVIAPYKQ